MTGIFTREDDAAAHKAQRNAYPRHENSATVQKLTMDQITTLLVRDRIRELADAVDRLIGFSDPRKPRHAPNPRNCGRESE